MQIERQHYRKNLQCCGHMVLEGKMLDFTTKDVSIGGMKIHVDVEREWQQQDLVEVFLDELQTQGHASIVWAKPDVDGGSLIGMRFTDLSSTDEGLAHRLQ